MKHPKISHAIADISYKDSLDNLCQLKILIGDEYEAKIAKQPQVFKKVELSSPDNIFYVRDIDELRSFMKVSPLYNFVIRSYLVYSFLRNSTKPKDVYVSDFGGNKVNASHIKSYLVHSIFNTKDSGLLSQLIEIVSGYNNSYDVQSNAFILSDYSHTHCRRKRIDDDVIINSVFMKGRERHLSNQDIIKMMRDNNMIPKGMFVKDEFIALEPSQIISLAYLLIETKEEEPAKPYVEMAVP